MNSIPTRLVSVCGGSRPEPSEPLWQSFAGALLVLGGLVAAWIVL